jgi:hypothetical protein
MCYNLTSTRHSSASTQVLVHIQYTEYSSTTGSTSTVYSSTRYSIQGSLSPSQKRSLQVTTFALFDMAGKEGRQQWVSFHVYGADDNFASPFLVISIQNGTMH